MTVKISGDGGLGPLLGLNKGQKTQRSKDGEKSQTQTTDRVSFSSVLQSMNRTQDAAPTAGAGSAESVAFSPVLPDVQLSGASSTSAATDARAARVAELKAQVADGSYRPDLNKVAASLLQFVAERS